MELWYTLLVRDLFGRVAHTQVKLLHKYRYTFDILYSPFPRHSPPVVLQSEVGKTWELRLSLREMYASGKI